MNPEHWDEMPPIVAKLKAEVEAEAEAEVYFQESGDDIWGAMTYEWLDNGPVVFCKRYSHAGAAEELLHMRLDLRGYLMPRLTINCLITCQAITVLHNALQHAVIFPQLETMGFPPDQGECESVGRQFDKHAAQGLDVGRLAQEPGLLALFAMLYVRAKRHCPVDEAARLVGDLYGQAGYADARNLGEPILAEINLDGSSSAEVYNSVLRRCLAILGLADVTLLVDPRGRKEV